MLISCDTADGWFLELAYCVLFFLLFRSIVSFKFITRPIIFVVLINEYKNKFLSNEQSKLLTLDIVFYNSNIIS